mgnify:CR=1 FL=1
MCKYQVKLKKFPQQQPNGDRDPNRHLCHKYELHLHKLDVLPLQSVLIDTGDDFDHWMTSIDSTRTEYFALLGKGRKLAKFFDSELIEMLMVKKVISTEEWVEA